jgi:uncharacterized damage-inducible protein DinB
MDVTTALLDSWDRQCRIVRSVAGLINDSNREFKPSADGMPLYGHLAHIHSVRKFFLAQLDREGAYRLIDVYRNGWEDPIEDLETLRLALDDSAAAVRAAVLGAFATETGKSGWYDNPVLYLQHMIWHEGWHVGLMFLALRLNGQEPAEDWEEANVWGEWRTEG